MRTALTPGGSSLPRGFALPTRSRRSRDVPEVRATVPAYNAATDDLVDYVSHSCAVAAEGSQDQVAGGVEALLRWLRAQPARARLLLLDGPAGDADVMRARAVAHRRFVDEIVAAVPGSEPAMVAAGVSAIENLLASHLLRGGVGTLGDLAPVVAQIMSALCPLPVTGARRARSRPL